MEQMQPVQQTLAGRVVWVTGAGRGIGSGIAHTCAEHGATVAVMDIQKDSAAAVAEAIRARGGKAAAWRGDVTDRPGIRAVVADMVATFGKLDVLVNNAGIHGQVPLIDMEDEAWDRMINVNLTGVYNCSKAALPYMLDQGSGNIISIASVVGITGSVLASTHYAVAKGGVITLTRSIARELGTRGIRANAIAPGFIATEMTAGLGTAGNNQYIEKSALHRAGRPEEIGSTVVFLASDDSSYITGQTINVCGGYLIA